MPSLQIAFEQAQAAGIGVGARRNSNYRLEFSLQVERAQVKGAGQSRQALWLIEILFDVAANGLHRLRLPVAKKCLRTATPAGAVARALGFFRTPEKRDVLPSWPLRRA